jgi:DNA-directed RNA polymerase specialized sigma24 family protein
MHSTATIDVMEQRLREWGAWMNRGASADGYATKSVLHPSWMPPTAGQLPNMTVSYGTDRPERQLHGHIHALSDRMQATLVAVYVKRLSGATLLNAVQCQESTVRARVIEAKRLLAVRLDADA